MDRTTTALLLAALLSSACQPLSSLGTNVSDGGTGQDLATTPAVLGQVQTTTIRDLNADKFPSGTNVHVVGVMESPVTVGYAVEFGKSCTFESIVVQADPAPTLKDGIAVRSIKHNVVTGGDMTVSSADCQKLVANPIAWGDSVVIVGTLVVSHGIHSIDLGTVGSVSSMGRAQTMPQPVVVTAAQLPSAPLNSPLVAQFASAYGALVTLQNTVSSEMSRPNLEFMVSASATDANKTRVSPEYLQLFNSSYMPPVDGTKYTAVTGLVSTDRGGSILPRSATDLMP